MDIWQWFSNKDAFRLLFFFFFAGTLNYSLFKLPLCHFMCQMSVRLLHSLYFLQEFNSVLPKFRVLSAILKQGSVFLVPNQNVQA